MTEYLGWHFSTGVLGHGDGRSIVAGETHQITGAIVPCASGLHASALALDALNYADANVTIVARVRLSGTVIEAGDKAVASHRTYLSVAPCGPILHEFACRCAEVALMTANVEDDRCWHAINVKREWLAGRATDAQLAAARDAAWAAARAAARDAAWAAARAAARAAAWAAAGAAAWAAARAAAGAAANTLLEEMLTEALGD